MATKNVTKTAMDPAVATKLLAGVLAAPEEDAPRLAYAAYLTKHGDPRGEFIEVQCDLAKRGDKTEKEDPKTKPLWTRAKALQKAHSAKWTKQLKALGPEAKWWMHRGFVRALEVDAYADDVEETLAAILAVEPVTELALGGDAELLQKIFAVAGIERIRRLVVHDWSPADGGAHVGVATAKAKRLTGVRELRVGVKLGDEGIVALAKPAALGDVTHLCVGAAGIEDAATFAKLASSSLGQRLEILEWVREDVTPEIAKRVLELPKLHTFVLSEGYCDEDTKAALDARFGERCIVEDEPSTEYMENGVHGVSFREMPKRR